MNTPWCFLILNIPFVLGHSIASKPALLTSKNSKPRLELDLKSAGPGVVTQPAVPPAPQNFPPAVPPAPPGVVTQPRSEPTSSSAAPPLPTVNAGTPTGTSAAPVKGISRWSFVKIILGGFLISPVVEHIVRWELSGKPPHPFLLSEHALPRHWQTWQEDLGQFTALLGVDLMLLGGAEINWRITIYILGGILLVRTVYGYGSFIHCMTSVSSPYGENASEEKKAGHNVKDSGYIQASNAFQDLGTSMVRLVILVLAQMTFFGFFVMEMMEEVNLTHNAYRYWFAAIPMQFVSRSLLGRSICNEVACWNRMFHLQAASIIEREKEGVTMLIHQNKASIVVRATMSFYVNNVSMTLIALTLPLFMMSSATDIDFVKDCFAVVFITTLDDIDEVQLKFPSFGSRRSSTIEP